MFGYQITNQNPIATRAPTTNRRESRAVATNARLTLHIVVEAGTNSHHMIEACFKGVGRALRQAFRREGDELPTTKGVL